MEKEAKKAREEKREEKKREATRDILLVALCSFRVPREGRTPAKISSQEWVVQMDRYWGNRCPQGSNWGK